MGVGMLYRKRGLAGNPAGESRSPSPHSITTSRITHTHTQRGERKNKPQNVDFGFSFLSAFRLFWAAKLVPPPTYYRVILTLYRRTSLAHYKVGNSCGSCCCNLQLCRALRFLLYFHSGFIPPQTERCSVQPVRIG